MQPQLDALVVDPSNTEIFLTASSTIQGSNQPGRRGSPGGGIRGQTRLQM
jgi:hypothetical protein